VNVRLLAAAQIEVIDAADAYDQLSPGTGDRFLVAMDDLVARLTAHPRMYGCVSRAPSGHEIRRARIPGFLYTAVYEVTATEVIILSVTHARSVRQPWRRRLP
jgi:plasmid stabilization system protein ParE